MSTNFPSALDTFTNPNGSDSLNAAAVPHAEQHANANDAIEALQAKVGINGSAVATSLDYRISTAETGLDGKISSSEKGSANGVATLGFDGKVPSSQLPPLDYIPTSEKGAAGGVAGLDEAGKVPAAQLPSYVDDVLEYANLAAFPVTGEAGKIYVALDTNKAYRWSGSTYVYITSGAVDSVAGKTGVVSLVKADVGLSNVDNTSDANKPISTATQAALDGKAPLYSPALTGAASLTANTSTPALTITQTGTGDALRVEDSASPDSTPFVITADGAVGIGTASPEFGGLTVAKPGNYSLVLKGDDFVTANIRSYRESGSDHAQFNAFAARGTESAPAILASGDRVFSIKSYGWDGAAWVRTAEIRAEIDNTTAAGLMPGRLVFSTTPSGSSTPVERMRIDSEGRVGIGASAAAGENVRLIANVTGAVQTRGIVARGVVQSDVTTNHWNYHSSAATVAASFTLTDYVHYQASQGTLGAGSTVTNQYGFNAQVTLTGATNNYGFYGNIPAGTGRYNFYAAGTADNVFNGNVKVINGSAGLGYGTGAGGTVTQVTSKSTAVTLNKPCGQITMNNAALAAGASVVFAVNNSLVTTSDLVVVGGRNAGVDPINYRIETAQANGNGAFAIRVTNISAGSLSEALQIQFAIIKGATA